MVIPQRLLEQMTPDERADFDATLDGWRNSITGVCPKCSEPLTVRVKLTGSFIQRDTQERTPPKAQQSARPQSQIDADERFIEDARASGMLAAFEECVQQLNERQRPSNTGEFLLTVLRTYGEKVVPRAVLERYKSEFGGRIDFWSAQGVIVVLSDRIVRAFVPHHLIFGAAIRDARGKARGTLGTDEQRFDLWVRGKHGYVPADAKIFADAMAQRTRGDFAKVVQ